MIQSIFVAWLEFPTPAQPLAIGRRCHGTLRCPHTRERPRTPVSHDCTSGRRAPSRGGERAGLCCCEGRRRPRAAVGHRPPLHLAAFQVPRDSAGTPAPPAGAPRCILDVCRNAQRAAGPRDAGDWSRRGPLRVPLRLQGPACWP